MTSEPRCFASTQPTRIQMTDRAMFVLVNQKVFPRTAIAKNLTINEFKYEARSDLSLRGLIILWAISRT
ncbi:hypothetical protein [Nostoc sp.]|uniref:hypothetical protein n=1 Tax=Nostoc sp. TaxID=1180 RepID=UPI002FFCC03F